MKQYTVTKVVYANSFRQAIEKEKEGMVVNVSLNEVVDQSQYEEELERYKKLRSWNNA